MPKTKNLTYREKQMVLNVRSTFENEKQKIKFKIDEGMSPADFPFNFINVVSRTANALKLSKATVKRVTAEKKREGTILPLKDMTGRRRIVVDSFTEGVIRRKVLEFYSKKTFPNLIKLHSELQDDQNFPKLSRVTLWRIMRKQLKFKFVKFQGKPVPMEREDIKAQRFKYLSRLARYRKEGYEIFYQDESWLNIPEKEVFGMQDTHPHIDIWLKGVGHRFTDGLMGGISSKPSGAGKRVIMINIGSENGFLEGAAKNFVGEKGSTDYHKEMNSSHFLEWFSNVLAIIPEHSVIVIDQATYHRSITEDTKNPTSKWRKADIIAWLKNKAIPVPEDYDCFEKMVVPSLRILAKSHTVESKFLIEDMVNKTEKDVKIIWLPVAHCELNAIELIWSSVKRFVATNNNTFKIKDVLALINESLNSEEMATLWKDCSKHIQELEKILMKKELIEEKLMEDVRNRVVIPSEDQEDTDSDSETSVGRDDESDLEEN